MLPVDVDVTGDDRLARQARSGTRWLVLVVDLNNVSCSNSVLGGSDYRLDVDGAFVDNATFVNETFGSLFGQEQTTLTLTFKVPVDASTIDLAIAGAPTVPIPTTNLG